MRAETCFMFIEPIYRSVLMGRILTALTLLEKKTQDRQGLVLSVVFLSGQTTTQLNMHLIIFDKEVVKFKSDLS